MRTAAAKASPWGWILWPRSKDTRRGNWREGNNQSPDKFYADLTFFPLNEKVASNNSYIKSRKYVCISGILCLLFPRPVELGG
jgi:hypothetical protein